jgi:hypothetical protein
MSGYGRVRHTAARSQLLCPEPCCIGHRGVGDVEEVVGMKKAAVSGCVVGEEVGGTLYGIKGDGDRSGKILTEG